MTREELIKELEDFGFKVVDRGCDHLYIINPKNICTGLELRQDCIEFKIDNNFNVLASIAFTYDMIRTKILSGGDTFSILSKNSKGNSAIFINLYNF